MGAVASGSETTGARGVIVHIQADQVKLQGQNAKTRLPVMYQSILETVSPAGDQMVTHLILCGAFWIQAVQGLGEM